NGSSGGGENRGAARPPPTPRRRTRRRPGWRGGGSRVSRGATVGFPRYKKPLDPGAQAGLCGGGVGRGGRREGGTRPRVGCPSEPDRPLTQAVRRPTRWAYRFPRGQRPNRRFFYFGVDHHDYVGGLWIVEATLTLESG